MQRILITGGAGYVGSVLTGRLLAHGAHITVLDNLLYGQATLLHYCSSPRFQFVYGDARDEALVKRLIAAHDVIIPLAAIVGAPACDRDPLAARSLNVDAVAIVNRLRSRQQAVIIPSTNSGYGTRSGDVYCTEETPLEPISLYGVTKVEAERNTLDAGNSISLRLATVFGPSPRLRLDLLVNDFVYRAVTDRFLVLYEENFKRNFIHVEDVADCFVHCVERFESMKNQAYNVGMNDANLSKAELAEKIKTHVPQLSIQFAQVGADPDRRNYIVSNEKILATGFATTRSLDDGIEQLLKAFRLMPQGRQYRNA